MQAQRLHLPAQQQQQQQLQQRAPRPHHKRPHPGRSCAAAASRNTSTTSTTSTTTSTTSPSSSALSSLDLEGEQLQAAAAFQQAFLGDSLALGFSAGGLLFPYYLGVCEALEDLNILRPSTQLAGASAGSLIAVCAKSGLPHATLRDACWELARDCRRGGTRHRLRSVLQGTLQALLPDDIAERCTGVVHVAVTRVTPALTPQLVSQFTDRDDLIAAALTSCHIPWYFHNGSLVTRFRGGLCLDGGITNFLPNVPGQTTARVCCLPRSQLAAIRNITISPDAFNPWPHDVGTMLGWALEPADEDMLDELLACGRSDATLWAQQTGLAVLASSDGSSMSSMSSSEGEDGSPAVVLPSSSYSPAAAVASQDEGQQQPVGTSLIGLARTLIAHGSGRPRQQRKD